ncbi:MAG: sulfur carrier protein ThiS [Phycisphaeraceae bacterium]|nr:sulfur carrier protein ThiS [Phycisphaeraceae bacterium]
MRLTVNGETTDAREGQTVRELIDQLKLGDRAVAVEVNKKLVPRRLHETTRLATGDVVELVTLVGGG